jgi:hypothetical protein
MERASKLFGPKFTPSGAGKYSPAELKMTYEDLMKNPPEENEGEHLDRKEK